MTSAVRLRTLVVLGCLAVLLGMLLAAAGQRPAAGEPIRPVSADAPTSLAHSPPPGQCEPENGTTPATCPGGGSGASDPRAPATKRACPYNAPSCGTGPDRTGQGTGGRATPKKRACPYNAPSCGTGQGTGGRAVPKKHACPINSVSSMCNGGLQGTGEDGGSWGGPFGIFNAMGRAFTAAQGKALEWLFAFWVKPDTGVVSAKDNPNNPNEDVGWLLGRLWVFVGFTAVLGLLVAAGRLAWQRRGEPARQAFQGLLTLTVVTGCVVGTVGLIAEAGDRYSEWIIQDALHANGTAGWVTISAAIGGGANPMAWPLATLLGLIGILASLTQLALMIVRSVMLGLLTGFLPILAAGTMTKEGSGGFRKAIGWLVAFGLYKPVAATIYAYGFRLVMSSDEQSQATGLIVVVMALVALPALLRFVMPLVAGASGSGGGDTSVALALAAAQFSGSRGGGQGSPGPTGAAPTGAAPTGSPTGGAPDAGGAASASKGKAATGGAATAGLILAAEAYSRTKRGIEKTVGDATGDTGGSGGG